MFNKSGVLIPILIQITSSLEVWSILIVRTGFDATRLNQRDNIHSESATPGRIVVPPREKI